MAHISRALFALSAIAALLLSPETARAQNSPITVRFVNTTSQCIWVTFYKRDASGIGGTLTPPQQIRDNRPKTGPREVQPKSTFEFTLPRVGWLKILAEGMSPCGSNTGARTDMTMDSNVRNVDFIHITLHANGNSFWLTRP
jgi:hypothetical protein